MEESESRDIGALGSLQKTREGRKKWGKNCLETKKVELVTGCFEKCFSRIEDQKSREQRKEKKNTHTHTVDSSLSRVKLLENVSHGLRNQKTVQ